MVQIHSPRKILGGYMWKIFISTFVAIFLAELGDKTQFAVFSLSAEKKSPFVIAIAATLAMGASSLIAAMLGNITGHFVSPRITRYVAGAVFVILGVVILFGKM